MLAHNAVLCRVPFEMGALLDAARGSSYIEALQAVTDLVQASQEAARPNAPGTG